ncbi:MAG: hypothetical protein QOG62_1234 [Thermoleophilaceae bacterium]|jgi:hypothetical protein|nr:hypothetical protein [Thermoleophilaceae bacterium]
MSAGALAEVVAAVDPAVREHALAEIPEGRWHGDPDRAFVLEAVYEGHLLHHGSPRAFDGMDDDLRLLAGDELYALGLSRLAALGDLAAVAELAELISLCAWARSEGHGDDLVETLWQATESRLREGSGPGARAALEAFLSRADR